MKVFSFISENGHLTPIEVELTLWPGLPGIQFLGLPDQHLKESALRIKSAIKHQGFEFPKARQILVNLRPSHLKKNSRGIELAVAAALLWETRQLSCPIFDKQFFIYGELNLSGEVFEPEDLSSEILTKSSVVLTGGDGQQSKEFRRMALGSLRDLKFPREIPAETPVYALERPQLPANFCLSSDQAQVLEVAALGGHSLLLAGPAGSGKSTMAKALHSLLPIPEPEEWNGIVEIQKRFMEASKKSAVKSCTDIKWRPLVKPHHSTPKMAMVGGGSVPMAGEISRAHGGILFLDEFLEFSGPVQEALREPFEDKLIRVARGGQVQEFPAGGQIIGTTNLCPCGEKIPGETERPSCRFGGRRCNSYSQRLSGPLLDRFQMLVFLKPLERPSVPWERVQERIDRAVAFRKARAKAPQQPAFPAPSLAEQAMQIEASLDPLTQLQAMTYGGSERRRIATLCVARSLADLSGKNEVSLRELDQAMNWTARTFEKMRRWDLELGPKL